MALTSSLRVPAVVGLVLVLTVGVTTPAFAAPPPTPDFGPEIDAYARYDGQSTCDLTEKPGVVAFRAMLQRAYGANGNGITRSCNVGGTSEHKEGRAYDWILDASSSRDRAVADELLGWLLATDEHGNAHARARRLGVMYIIWNRQIWSAYRPSQGWQPYSGANPHTDHIHFSFSWDGAMKRTSWWTSASQTRQTFPDVTEADYYYEPVDWMVGHGITTGWGETGRFRPHERVTRAQMAAFLHRLMDEPGGHADHGFTDVASHRYYDEPARWLRAQGLTEGVNGGSEFAPHRTLSRAEMATFLWRIAGRPTPSTHHGFPDVSSHRYYDVPVAWLAEHGLTTGYGETGRFEPGRPVTRAQTAAFMHRLAGTPAAWQDPSNAPSTVRFN